MMRQIKLYSDAEHGHFLKSTVDIVIVSATMIRDTFLFLNLKHDLGTHCSRPLYV